MVYEEETMSEITFKSKWFEKCIRDYLGLTDDIITEEELGRIKYLYVSTTNDFELGFGSQELKNPFSFSNSGDEWEYACISDTGRYNNLDEFVEIKKYNSFFRLYLKKNILELEEDLQDKNTDLNFSEMKEFENNIKYYYAEDEDYEGLTEDEDTYDMDMLFAEDFGYLTNLETLRLMSCETEIHSLKFLEKLDKLKVLEIGEVRLNELDGLDKLIGLDRLCIWAN